MDTQSFFWTAIAWALVMFWLAFAVLAKPKVAADGALVVMEYGRKLGLTALVCALTPPTLLATLAWNVPWRSGQTLFLVGVSFLVFSLIAGLLLIEVVRVRIVLTADGITRHSPWTGRASVKWKEVTSVHFSTFNRWFVIRSDAATIRVSQYLTGQKAFAQALIDNIPVEHRITCEMLNQ